MVLIEDLHVEFATPGGVVKALRGVNLAVHSGEALALMGENGCGKSVTARAMVKLLPSPSGGITGGRIRFEGENIAAKSDKELQKILGRDIGFVFQDPMSSLNPTMKVGAQVAEVLKWHGRGDIKRIRERVLELFGSLGITSPGLRFEQYPHQISGGLRQRVMLAMALACGPKLLVADEPTAAVDVTVRARIMKLLKDLQEKTAMAILLITHDLDLVADLARRMAVMYAGKIVESGPAGEIVKNPLHPYTRGLLASLPELAASPGKRLTEIPGRPPSLLNQPPGCLFRPRCSEAVNICARIEPPEMEAGKGRTVCCWAAHPAAAEYRPERTVSGG